MSYDILFVPRRSDQTWTEALDAAEGTDVLSVAIGPERLAQWDRIVAALRRRLGEVEVSLADDACEATHAASGLQVSLFPNEAAVTFPYWQREDVASFHDTVVDVVGVVERETGLSAWDAQADTPFDGSIHDEAGVAAALHLTRSGGTAPVPVHGTAASPSPAVTGSDTPALALERKRALRYFVLGAVIIIASLLWRAQGETSALSGLALAVGVADLVIGGLLWRGYQRRRAHGG